MAARKNPRRIPPETIAKLEDADWLRGRYLTEGLSTKQVGALIGVTGKTISTWLSRHDIPARARRAHDAAIRLADAEWLTDRYLNDGLTVAQIALELHVDNHVVRSALNEHGIRRPCGPGARSAPELTDEAWLRATYADRTGKQICEQLGVSTTTLYLALNRYGIRREAALVAE